MTTLNTSTDQVYVVERGGENITELMREAEEITDNIEKIEEILSDTEEVIEKNSRCDGIDARKMNKSKI